MGPHTLFVSLVGSLTSQHHANVSQGRICLTSQHHANVSQGRICLTSQHHANVSQGRICLTSQHHANVSQGRICLTSQHHANVSQGRICLTSQHHANVSQGRICSDDYTETKVTDPAFYLTHTQYTDTGPTSPNTDPIPPGDCQGSHWGANVEVTGMTPLGKKSPRSKQESNPGCIALGADVLTTRPTRRSTQVAGLKALHQIRVCHSRGGRLNH